MLMTVIVVDTPDCNEARKLDKQFDDLFHSQDIDNYSIQLLASGE